MYVVYIIYYIDALSNVYLYKYTMYNRFQSRTYKVHITFSILNLSKKQYNNIVGPTCPKMIIKLRV